MQKENVLFAKAKQINLCGVIGLALALIGLLLPSIKVSYMGMGMSGTMFEVTMWTILPLILILGACALYVLKFDVLGLLATIVSALVYFIVLVACRAEGRGQIGDYGVGIHYTWGFYIAFLGFMIAIAAPWINKLVFKPQNKQPKQQFNPNMPQGGPGMNMQNPYMGQGQPGQFMNQGQPQPGQFMNQGQPQPGQFMNQGQPQPGQYMNQAGQQANPYMNQMQNQAGQFMNQGAQQVNPYMNQMQNQMNQAQNAANQAVNQAEQFVQNTGGNTENQ